MKTEASSQVYPLASGLLVLWSLIALAVVLGSPEPPNTSDLTTLHNDQGPVFFLDAVTMAKRQLPDPEARWSHALTDANAGCLYLGHDFCFAHGVVWVPSRVEMPWIRWEEFFVLGESNPRYLRIGDHSIGDRNEALRAAIKANSPANGAGQ